MTTVLVTLTLAYAVILVVVLAVSLIRILLSLAAIGRALGQVKTALVMVDENTGPLAGQIGELNRGLGAISVGFTAIRGHLN